MHELNDDPEQQYGSWTRAESTKGKTSTRGLLWCVQHPYLVRYHFLNLYLMSALLFTGACVCLCACERKVSGRYEGGKLGSGGLTVSSGLRWKQASGQMTSYGPAFHIAASPLAGSQRTHHRYSRCQWAFYTEQCGTHGVF